MMGGSTDRANGVALTTSAAGAVVVLVAGSTDAADFPVTAGAYDPTLNGLSTDAFLSAVSADGTTLTYSTYLGGDANDAAHGVAVDPGTREAVVVGATVTPFIGAPFPVVAAHQGTPGGMQDAFVTRFSADGSTVRFSTLLGGGGVSAETAYGVAVDRAGDVVVAGETGAGDFPTTTGAYDRVLGGTTDGFVARFSGAGALKQSTLYGGSGADGARAVAADRTDRVYVTGVTASSDLPVPHAVDGSLGGSSDGFVARFTSLAYAPEFGTYRGGGYDDAGYGVAADADSRAVVVGVEGGMMGSSVATTRYAPDGRSVEWSATWGSGFGVSGNGAAVGTDGAVFAAGTDGSDAVVLKYTPVPAPVITGLSDDTGSSSSDRLTGDTTPTVNGTSYASATVSVYRTAAATGLATLLGTTTASASGLWTYTLATIAAEGTYGLTATATVSGSVSLPSAPLTFTLDTSGPAVSVAVASQTYDRRPPITVTASDLYGLSSPATVTLDVDLNNDNDFADPNETGFATGTLVNGAYTFEAYTTLLTVGVTARVRARVLDAGGVEGTSPVKTVEVLTSPVTWVATTATAAARGAGSPLGGTAAADAMVYAGDLTAGHALDLDASAAPVGGRTPYLVYHSQQAAPAPVVQAWVRSDNALALPTSVLGTLTWDGAVAGTVAYDLSQLSPGSDWVFGAAPGTGLGTGRHTYTLDLYFDHAGGGSDFTRSVTGQTFLVDRSNSAYGAGWTFAGTDALVTVAASGSYSAGVLRLFGAGGWAFYEDTGGGTYVEPAGDAGTLTGAGGAWTYTGWDGRALAFDASGRMTTWTSADGEETLTYTYDGGTGTAARVATVAGPDGGVATFAYASGLLATIEAPGSRTTTFTLSGTDLVTVADPSGAAHTFTYAAHRATGETREGVAAAFTYSGGLVQTTKVGTDPVGTIVAALGSGVGTAAVAQAQGVRGTSTNPLGAVAQTWFNAFGQPVATRAADGGRAALTRDANGYVTGATDPLDRTTGYTVNAKGQVEGIVRADATTATVAYAGANGALSGYTDYRGGLWTFTSDAYGRQETSRNPLNQTTTFTYDAGLRKTVTDALGNVVTSLYDAQRRPTGALVGGAVTGTTGYDAAGNPTTFTDALNNVTTTVYDGAGRVTAVTDPAGATTTSTYATTGRLLSTTDPAGTTSYAYDAAGRVEVTIRGFGTGLAQRTTSVFDGAGNLVATVNALGHRTTSVFDAQNRVIATVDALGNRTTTLYDLAGQVSATLDALGRVTRFGYDALGRQVTVTDALGNVTTTVYDADSRVVATVDALGFRSTSVFDAAGQLTAQVDALGNRVTFGYDAAGRQVTTTDPLGNVSTTVYDARGRVEATIDALGKRVTTVFDAADRVLATVDANGNRTTSVYDSVGRVVATVDALNNRSTSVYDGAGRVVASVDALGNTSTTVFDALGRAEATVDALGNRATSVYDAADRMVARIDALGNRATTVYDDIGRAVAQVDALGNRATSVFDAAGNLIAQVDALGYRTTFALDGLNRVIATTDPLSAVSSVSYDAAGRQVTATDPRGNVTTTVYDNAGRPTERIDALGSRATSVYDGAGNAVATVDALGRRTTSVFDALNRPHVTVDALNQRTTVAFDDAGNAVAQIDALGRTTTSVFDALNRAHAQIDAMGNRTTSVFDAAGNMTVQIDALGRRTTSVFDALNRAYAQIDALGNRATSTFDAAGNVRTTIDALGRTTTFAYDARNQQVTTTDALGKVWTTVYDELGRGWRRVDPNDNDTRTYFDAAGRAAESADGLNNRTRNVFDAAGNAVAAVDALDNVSTTVYDALNRGHATVDALGNRSTTVFDAVGNAVARVDALGRRTTAVFDALNRVEATVDALGNRSTSVFDAVGNATVMIDALGRRTTSTFDSLNRVLTTTDALGGVASTTYSSVGTVSTRVDQLGRTTSYGYDALNRMVTTTDALGGVFTTAYDAAGNAVAATNALGHTTTSVFDSLNRVQATVDALGNRTTSVFDDAGRVTASVNQLGHRTTYGYDARGLVQTVTDPLGNVSTSTFDAAGNQVATTNARGYTTTTVYDALNRAQATVDALGNRTTSVFDAVGNRTATIDALGYRTTAVYDDLNRVAATVSPLGNRATTTFDAVGNVKTQVDALNQTTSYGYDALNRQTTEQDARGYTTTSVFDAVGSRTVLVDASANRTTFGFDALNRVTTETDPQNVSGTFAYDAAGRTTGETDRLGRRRDFGYDAANRVLTEKWYAVGGALVQTQTFTYDAAGRALTAVDPDGAYTLAYDAAGRVTSVQEPFGLVLTMGYDGVGNRALVQDSKGGTTTVVFDALSRQTSERVAVSGGSAMRFDHGYTARGQVSSVTRYSDLAGTSVVGTVTHDYDAAGRETHLVQRNGSGTVLANYTYTFDAGDRLDGKVENGTGTSYSYDAADQLTADGATTFGYDGTGNRTNTGYATGTGNRVTSDGLWTWTYDANGNATKRSKGASGDTWVYGYDHRNQMVSAAFSATDGGAVTARVTYVLDAWGNRIERLHWDGATTLTERFGYDGWDPAQPVPVGQEKFNVWADLDATNALTMRRAYGFGFDEVIARQTSAGVVLWYGADHQRSVRLLSDNSGTVVGTVAYAAFGAPTASGTTDRLGYTGHDLDAALGLIATPARMYDWWTGKFLQMDTMGFAAGDPNLFRYVGNSPTNATDPSGKMLFAVGEWGMHEAVWHIEHTFGKERSDILVTNLGPAGPSIWERSSPTDDLYYLDFKPGSLSYSNAASRAPNEAIAEMWKAYSSNNQHRIVARVDRAKRPNAPDGNPWPGKWHTRPFDDGTPPFYIGTQIDPSQLLTPNQQDALDEQLVKRQAMETERLRLLAKAPYLARFVDPSAIGSPVGTPKLPQEPKPVRRNKDQEWMIKNDKLAYYENAGWIDWYHATPDLANQILSQIRNRRHNELLRKCPDGWFRIYVDESQNSQTIKERITKSLFAPTSYYLINRNAKSEINSIALAVFKHYQVNLEINQGNSIIKRVGTSSSFSMEDLPSDLVGFYLAVNNWQRENVEPLLGTKLKPDQALNLFDRLGGSLGHEENKNRNWTP